MFGVAVTGADASCGEATCVPVQGTYVSHFTGAGCTGTESYYLPYDGYAYDCRSWDGGGQCGTIERTVTNRSARINNGPCQDLWPSGNTLSQFVTIYRSPGCGEATCIPAQGTYVSHFTKSDCAGTESYYLPYDGYAYDCRTWDGGGQCGTIERTVTNRSARINGGPCQNLWPGGNTLSQFVTVYRGAPPPPANVPPQACGFASGGFGSAPQDVWLYGTCSSDSDGYITNYQWDVWDGFEWGPFAFHTFWNPGAYPIWLTVWDDDGAWDTTFIGTIWVY
jgi:hypothetical protein